MAAAGVGNDLVTVITVTPQVAQPLWIRSPSSLRVSGGV